MSQENAPLDHDQDAAIPKNPADRKKLLISSAPRVPTHSAGPLFVGSTQGFTGGLCGPEENQANMPEAAGGQKTRCYATAGLWGCHACEKNAS